MSINTDIRELLILRKNVKPSHFPDVIEMGSICFMLERKSFSDSQSSEVIMTYCLTRKLKMLFFSYSTLYKVDSTSC